MTRRYSAAVRTERARHFASRIAVRRRSPPSPRSCHGLAGTGRHYRDGSGRPTRLSPQHDPTPLQGAWLHPRKARADLLVRRAAEAAKLAPLFDMVYGDRCADRRHQGDAGARWHQL